MKRIDLEVSKEVYEYLDKCEQEGMQLGYKRGVLGKGLKAISEKLVDELVQGAILVHEHGGSEPIPRMHDEFDMAINFTRAGLRAAVIKTHYTPSSCRVALVQRYVNEWAERNGLKATEILGGVVLNYPVGGLNPAAVRSSAGFPGGKFVWMPTVDSYNHIQITQGASTGYIQDVSQQGIRAVDERGKVVPELGEILRVIADKDLVLAIGHHPYEPDVRVITEEAKKAGVRRIMVDHPIEYHSKATISQMKELAKEGIYIGMYALTCLVIPPIEGYEYPAKIFAEVPKEQIVIGSDCGMTSAIPHVEGLRWMIRYMLFFDISEEDIRLMIRENPARLIGIISSGGGQ